MINFVLKIFLLTIILCSSVSGTSHDSIEWKLVGVSGLSTGEYKLYVDLQNLKKANDIVVMNELHSFRFQQFAPQGSYRSQIQKWEYDCKNGLIRALEKTLFEKHMAKGKLLATHFAGEVQWVEVKPGAALESKWRVACELAKS